MSQSVTQFRDKQLYLDTMVFYALLRNIDKKPTEAVFRRIERGDWQAYTSVLTFDELAYRLLLALVKENHVGNPLEHMRHRETEMIATHYPEIAIQITRIQQLNNLLVLDITDDDVHQMNRLILQYNLRPRDALHLAAMQKVSCTNILSQDSDFDKVATVQRFTLS
jgi:uncharacterized protein